MKILPNKRIKFKVIRGTNNISYLQGLLDNINIKVEKIFNADDSQRIGIKYPILLKPDILYQFVNVYE